MPTASGNMNKSSYQNVVCICGEKVNRPNRLTMHANCRHIWIQTFNSDLTKATAYLRESTRKRKEREAFMASLPEEVDNGVKQERSVCVGASIDTWMPSASSDS